ncbi:GNAT family N-acetyltransferase [Enterococcus rivorum]|nr:GNAT family N-acetyltransferase [Enterococcus rivorum]MBP2098508.1 ribosomal protein S18 acetylase RimI-like enzyme [Enterococcus rivorum]
MKGESEEWSGYYSLENQPKYVKAIMNSITHVMIENDILCGYIRCKNDDGFGIYILDLLVMKQYRGCEFGLKLIQSIANVFPNDPLYVTSDIDPYYEKIGFKKIGSILEYML